ncbi:MAG: aldolase [Rickettsiales bacterium]|nr:aldolase [Rickettsiales bacterium]|tara:strand:+ start:493 stop:1353 length:861 start_codon:yes stop_codon:yes gene_type:complete
MHEANERALRKQLVQASHLCYQQGLLVALDGNLSVRLSGELILCTPAGCHKGMIEEDDLIVVDLQGKRLRGGGEPTSELAMHLACYRQRPDIRAVVHAHPPTCIAFTVAGVSMARCVLPEVVLTLGVVPTLDYDTTGTQALADRVGSAMLRHDAVMMDRHGAVCVGSSPLDAFCKLETMEHMAKIMKAARDLGQLRDLPAEESQALRSMGLKRYGGPPAALAMADQPGADLPEACTGCSGCTNPSDEGLAPTAGFSVARITNTEIIPWQRQALEREVRKAISEVLG